MVSCCLMSNPWHQMRVQQSVCSRELAKIPYACNTNFCEHSVEHALAILYSYINYVISFMHLVIMVYMFLNEFLSVFDRNWYFDAYTGKPVPEGKDHNMWGVYSNIYPVCILYRRCKSIIVMEREKGGDNERYLKN